ncbi:hypothetical protein KJ766_03790 [Patescibacteria group bacterium]|nr:hypothetical protein [Patescibacteria group bacterium]
MEELLLTLILGTFIISLILGLYVFLQNPKNRISQVFGVLVLAILGWNLSIFLVLSGIGPMLLAARMSFSFGSLLVTAFAVFVLIFPSRVSSYRILSSAVIVIGGVFFLVPLLPQFVSWVIVEDGHITGDLHPVLTNLWGMSYLLVLFPSFFFLLIRTIRSKGVDYYRLRQVLIGFGLFLFPMFVTQFILPMVFGDFRWNNLGPIFTIFPIIFIAGAIINYRMLDIRLVFGKTVVVGIVTAFFAWILALFFLFISGFISQTYSIVLDALLIAVTFDRFHDFVSLLVNKVILSGTYDPKVAQEKIFHAVRSHVELNSLLKKLTSIFLEIFSAQKVSIIIFRPNTTDALAEYDIGYSAGDMSRLRKRVSDLLLGNLGILELGELQWDEKFGSDASKKTFSTKKILEMKSAGVDVIVPFALNGQVIGLMCLTGLPHKRMMRNRDIEFLDLMRSAVSPALENASKYEEMKRLYLELESLDQAKSDFIDVVSHRFKTPLSSIRWNVENILEMKRFKTAEVKEIINDCHESSLFLIETLNSIFDILEIESKKFKLQNTIFDIRAILADVDGQMNKMCKIKKIIYCSELEHVSISCDEENFKKVVKIILMNAYRYTQPGGNISLLSEVKRKHLYVSVKDDGIGIPEKDIKSVSNKFYRSRNAIKAYPDGQGTGLYFVKTIMHLCGGKLIIDSKEKKGTVITLDFPLK